MSTFLIDCLHIFHCLGLQISKCINRMADCVFLRKGVKVIVCMMSDPLLLY
jgi:hypothetical protein